MKRSIFKNIVIILSIFGCTSGLAINKPKFLLIMGPSGAGKSTVIQQLKNIDARFKYITPYTTRALRVNEHDKISISLEQMNELNKKGKLLTMNHLYGVYYGTPKSIIDDALSDKHFPVLDWPIAKIDIMQQHYKDRIYTVYIIPPNLEELKKRLSNDKRDNDNKRFDSGKEELKQFAEGKFNHLIDLKVINYNSEETAKFIYTNFIHNIG